MLIRNLLVLSVVLAVALGSLTGCQPPEAKAPPKKVSNTTQGKK